MSNNKVIKNYHLFPQYRNIPTLVRDSLLVSRKVFVISTILNADDKEGFGLKKMIKKILLKPRDFKNHVIDQVTRLDAVCFDSNR